MFDPREDVGLDASLHAFHLMWFYWGYGLDSGPVMQTR